MTQTAQAAAIELAHDELIWLLATLGLPPMIGMAERFFDDDLSEETAAARLMSGATSLRARRLMTSDGETTVIDSFILGILGAYAFAAQIAVINITPIPDDSSNLWTYYRGGRLCIEHTLIAPGVHRLTALDDALTSGRVAARLPLSDAATWQMDAQPLPNDALTEVIQRAKSGDQVGAEALLMSVGWDGTAAAAFVHVLVTQTGGASIALLSAEGAGEQRRLNGADSLIVIASPDANAVIVAVGEDGTGSAFSAVALLTSEGVRMHLDAVLFRQV